MTMRTRKETVTFERPFALSGLDGIRPAGVYDVETDEMLVEGVSFPAYRRLATWIRVPMKPDRPWVTEILNVDPKELDAALMRDAAPAAAPVDGNSARGTNKIKPRSSDEKADLAAEERSEDDGMIEHAKKAADPAAWTADRGRRMPTPAGAETGPEFARGREP